ncbi:hypothetical protein Aperf_G00000091732 [Anoplocephala perfoliata]
MLDCKDDQLSYSIPLRILDEQVERVLSSTAKDDPHFVEWLIEAPKKKDVCLMKFFMDDADISRGVREHDVIQVAVIIQSVGSDTSIRWALSESIVVVLKEVKGPFKLSFTKQDVEACEISVSIFTKLFKKLRTLMMGRSLYQMRAGSTPTQSRATNPEFTAFFDVEEQIIKKEGGISLTGSLEAMVTKQMSELLKRLREVIDTARGTRHRICNLSDFVRLPVAEAIQTECREDDLFISKGGGKVLINSYIRVCLAGSVNLSAFTSECPLIPPKLSASVIPLLGVL